MPLALSQLSKGAPPLRITSKLTFRSGQQNIWILLENYNNIGDIICEENIMRPILSICFLVLLPWKVNGDTTLHPSVSNQHGSTSESQRASRRDEGTSIVSISSHPTNISRSDGVFSTKVDSQFTENQQNTGKSHEKDKTAVTQITTEEKESYLPSSYLATVKEHSEDPQNHQDTNTSAIPSQFTQNQQSAGMRHKNKKTSNMQITTQQRESFLHSSSSDPNRKQTKRSLEDSTTNQTTSVNSPNSPLNVAVGQEHQVTHESNSTIKNGDEMSSEKTLNPQSNSTNPHNPSDLPTNPAVMTNKPGEVTAIPHTNTQTKLSTQVQDNKNNQSSAPGTQKQHTTNLTTDSITTGRDQTDTVPTSIDSSMEVTTTVNGFTTSRISSTVPMESVPTATPTEDVITAHKIVTSGTTTTKQASTRTPTTLFTTTQSTRPKPVTPQNKRKEKNKYGHHAGPIVAAIIGTVIVLMLIAIMLILVRKHRMERKQQENKDWAGPSPFLEGDAQPNQPGGDGVFYRRDTKRISLHSFFPLRASQRLSLLMEEEVQMNDIALNSTFGRNEQPQNGTPAVGNDQIQIPTANDQGLAPVASSSSTVQETGAANVTPVHNVNIQNPEPDNTVPSSSTETKTTPPPLLPFEEVKLNPPQTNTVNIPPAPPLP